QEGRCEIKESQEVEVNRGPRRDGAYADPQGHTRLERSAGPKSAERPRSHRKGIERSGAPRQYGDIRRLRSREQCRAGLVAEHSVGGHQHHGACIPDYAVPAAIRLCVADRLISAILFLYAPGRPSGARRVLASRVLWAAAEAAIERRN